MTILFCNRPQGKFVKQILLLCAGRWHCKTWSMFIQKVIRYHQKCHTMQAVQSNPGVVSNFENTKVLKQSRNGI